MSTGLWRYVTGAFVIGVPTGLAGLLVTSASAFGPGMSPLGAVPVPPENPITEEKRVLGKILFWDEQLSSDNTISCGTCHIPEASGADPVPTRIAGPDMVMFTPDDVLGSIGVVRSDSNNEFVIDPEFGSDAQVTGRAANSSINAAFADELFWAVGRSWTKFGNA